MFEKQCKIKVMMNRKDHVCRQAGFTLVELLVVMAIMIVLAIIMLGAFNPSGMFNRGRDSLRKKDLNRIKIAFEEYFNDKGTYPMDISNWNIKSNCGKNLSNFPYLKPWPCDPDGNPYKIIVYPNKFKILTNLENKKDSDIPDDWYLAENFVNTGGYTNDDVNYGVSSPNISWYDLDVPAKCSFYPGHHKDDVCLKYNKNGLCYDATENAVTECPLGSICYAATGDCPGECQVPCCGFGCPSN